MLKLITALAVITHSAYATELVRVETCGAQSSQEPRVYSDDFKWGMSLPAIRQKEQEIYSSGKRLNLRAFTEGNRIYIPHKMSGGVARVELTRAFIKSVSRQVENALRLKYVDALIFPDMGHSHFFIPHDVYEQYKDLEQDKFYEKILAHPKLKMLYHTAEQLKMLDDNRELVSDREIQWRFFTRNLIGGNEGLGRLEFVHNKEHRYNTAHDYDDNHRYWGAGFNISASKDGCFAYKQNGVIRYFDLSLYDLEPSAISNDE